MNERNFRTLDLNLLRVFDEVMAEGNLTRAAHNLAMTQPAVSNALRRLRETLGDDLVKRSGYGVEPTPAALALWPVVRDALKQLRESLSPGEFDPAQARNSFVLAMADATAALNADKVVILGKRGALRSPGFVASLPESLQNNLKNAALQTNMTEMDRLITQTSQYQPALAQEFQQLADDFEYGKILDILHTNL